MSGPNQRKQQRRAVIRHDRLASQEKWTDISMDGIVGDCAHTRVDEVADHRNIRHQEEQGEQAPTPVVPMVRQYTENEDGSAFQM